MNKLLVLILLLNVLIAKSQVNIIPQPAEMKLNKGFFTISNQTEIAYDANNKNSENAANFLADYLKTYYKIICRLTGDIHGPKAIILMNGGKQGKNGFYDLQIDKLGISIGGDDEGVFYGIQTLIQLLPVNNDKQKTINIKLQIPFVAIKDYPRFAYRGMHLDVGRHFMPVSFIKRYIDYIALHKMNYFHWHLTEDQGWRIEIKKYPMLTSVGGWRYGTIIGRYPGTGNDDLKYGGYYTQQEIKEVVKYAAERYITIIPEIEMPGHASAAIAAYPELSCFPNEPTIKYFPKQCKWSGDTTGKQVQQTWGVFDDVFCAGKENTFKVLEDVMDEVLALFPSKMIHVGGDECPKSNWKRCPYCQQRIKENGLKDEHELQSYFIQRMEKYLNSKGRKLIGWDEILEGGLAPNASVMSWRGEEGGIAAAKQNHDVVMTPGAWVYLDHSQSQNEDSVTIGGYVPLEKTYGYEPVPAALDAQQAKHVLGAQGNVWTEYMDNTRKVEYMIFPRMSALSEVLWSPKEKRDWKSFEKRLQTQFKRYDLWKANYSKAYFDLKATVLPSEDYKGVLWKLESNHKYKIFYTRDIYYSRVDPYTVPVKIKDIGLGYYAYLVNEKNESLSQIEQFFSMNKATGKKITLTNPPSDKYPGDGAFTLVNGVQNEKGLARSSEFLGFEGTDCEAVIDLSKSETIKTVIVHLLNQPASWIWRPQYAEVFSSTDGKNFTAIKMTDDPIPAAGNNATMKIEFNSLSTRFVKIVVKNWGDISEGNPGAGNKAWLFVDEIEVN